MFEHYGANINTYRSSQMVRCVLHEDNTPSCSINTEKQVWRCHSCGEGGGSYTLIEKMEGTDFDGARAFAATLGFPTGDSEGGGGELRSSAYSSRRKPPRKAGGNKGNGSYVPSWKRA